MEKKTVLSYELFFEYGGEGGMTRFARPAGSPLTVFVVCPTAAPVVEPRSGLLIPPGVQYAKKSSHFRTSSSLNMAVRGGMTRFARPAGSPLTVFVVCPTAAPVVEPRSGLLIPPGVQYAKKKLALSYELFFEYGGEGGIEPPIRCRIHTFQACSFSHSAPHQIVLLPNLMGGNGALL